jgi:hypothetical protein
MKKKSKDKNDASIKNLNNKLQLWSSSKFALRKHG